MACTKVSNVYWLINLGSASTLIRTSGELVGRGAAVSWCDGRGVAVGCGDTPVVGSAEIVGCGEGAADVVGTGDVVGPGVGPRVAMEAQTQLIRPL